MGVVLGLVGPIMVYHTGNRAKTSLMCDCICDCMLMYSGNRSGTGWTLMVYHSMHGGNRVRTG